MLSRVANSLYWMSRYIERAENIARLLDVNFQLLLDHGRSDASQLHSHWLPIVQAAGDYETFIAAFPEPTADDVSEFMVFAESNANSLVSSVCQARENARMVRDQIAIETWEELNRLYLFVRSPQARRMWEASPTDFFNEIKSSSLQLIGLSSATHIHNEGWWFSQAGTFIERADKTSRILDLRAAGTRGSSQPVTQSEALGWASIVRSCSAWDAHKSIYGGDVNPRCVAEFLLLNEDFPRSVRFCADSLDKALRRISGVAEGRFCNEAEKLSGRLVAELQFSSIDDVFDHGLHEYLDRIQVQLNAIGDALFNAYIFHAFVPSAAEALVQQEEQQQQQQAGGVEGRR